MLLHSTSLRQSPAVVRMRAEQLSSLDVIRRSLSGKSATKSEAGSALAFVDALAGVLANPATSDVLYWIEHRRAASRVPV